MWKLAFDLQGRCAENEAEDCNHRVWQQGSLWMDPLGRWRLFLQHHILRRRPGLRSGNWSEGCAAADSMKVECRHMDLMSMYMRPFLLHVSLSLRERPGGSQRRRRWMDLGVVPAPFRTRLAVRTSAWIVLTFSLGLPLSVHESLDRMRKSI